MEAVFLRLLNMSLSASAVIVLVILVAIRLVLPDSIISIKMDEITNRILDLFRGDATALVTWFQM